MGLDCNFLNLFLTEWNSIIQKKSSNVIMYFEKKKWHMCNAYHFRLFYYCWLYPYYYHHCYCIHQFSRATPRGNTSHFVVLAIRKKSLKYICQDLVFTLSLLNGRTMWTILSGLFWIAAVRDTVVATRDQPTNKASNHEIEQ